MVLSFDAVFEDQTKLGTKVQTSEYRETGAHIIVDQGQEQIAGYTDREEGIFTAVPAIIFGDHTRIIKYVDQPFFLGADGVKVLRCKKVHANYRYLYYALRHARIPDTGYNRHYKWLKEIDIEYPDASRQEEIVTILDGVCNIIAERQRQLRILDQLIKARFVEMFGDPFVNPMEWEQAIMKSVCKKITDGEHGSVPREAAGHPFLNAKHIKQNGTIDWQTITYTSDEVHKRIYSRCNPEAGDILMTTTGTIGNVAIVPAVEEFSMDRGITLLKLNRTIVSPRFVTWLLRFDAMQMIMTANIHASAIGHLFLNKVEQLPVIVPPMQLQEQFAAFVSQVDKSKAVVQEALGKAQLLFDSLMQQYFG